MRIVMPLFQFAYREQEPYDFDPCPLSIDSLSPGTIPDIEIFSRVDIEYMEEAQWCLVWGGSDTDNYKVAVNLTLIALRLCAEEQHRTPFVKYRFCSERPNLSAYLEETMVTNPAVTNLQLYDRGKLDEANQILSALLKMERLSIRTHNALYFLYRGLHNIHWADAFLMIVACLEALFSRDEPGGATKALSRRVASLLNSRRRCTFSDVKSLYEVRSKLVHGQFDAEADEEENLKRLAHLEFVALECFRELLKNDNYLCYSSKERRDDFMGTLNTASADEGGDA